jgi:hypothetical protein
VHYLGAEVELNFLPLYAPNSGRSPFHDPTNGSPIVSQNLPFFFRIRTST